MNIKITSAAYDFFKPVALVWLPALATLYTVLVSIWGLPDGKEIVGTLSGIDTFLGIVLHLSSSPPASVSSPGNDAGGGITAGSFIVDNPDSGKMTVTLNFDVPVEKVVTENQVVMKVVHI